MVVLLQTIISDIIQYGCVSKYQKHSRIVFALAVYFRSFDYSPPLSFAMSRK